MTKRKELLTRHDVFVPTDNAVQQRARLLQALWREEQGRSKVFRRGTIAVASSARASRCRPHRRPSRTT